MADRGDLGTSRDLVRYRPGRSTPYISRIGVFTNIPRSAIRIQVMLGQPQDTTADPGCGELRVCQRRKRSSGRARRNSKVKPHRLKPASLCAKKWTTSVRANMG